LKIVTIVGARPQFIKAAAVSRAIAEHNGTASDEAMIIKEVIVHTGQHFDAAMSDVFFEEMEIPRPHYNLNINSVGHGAMTGRMLEKIEEVLLKETPDFVMVYGDTNSTLAGALAAKKLHIRVVHVEAGLRSFNMRMPEEINRILTDRISDILCCPTDLAVQNLKKEGFELSTSTHCKSNHPLVVNTGDVMQDAATYYSNFSTTKSTIIKDLALDGVNFVLCTIHRAENTDDPLRLIEILTALNNISKKMRIVLPLHPRTRKIISDRGDLLSFSPIEPVGYFDMIELLKQTKVVLTDSGGLQKEAYFFKKPCITIRDETEWVELIEGGYNQLVGAEEGLILTAFSAMDGRAFKGKSGLYGDGNASNAIINAIAEFFKFTY
jgi:UDP-GlcNAc3NAcA epimerase